MAAGADDAAAAAAAWKWGGIILGAIGTSALAAVKWMLGRIVKKHDEEIAGIKGKLTNVETQVTAISQKLPADYTPIARHVAHEEKTRESIIALHNKIEDSASNLGDKIDENHRQIMNALLARK